MKQTIAAAATSTTEKKVLVILSATQTLEMKNKVVIGTGYFLDEFAVPAQALVAAGYKLDVATPGGVVATMDEKSNSVEFFHNDTVAYHAALEFTRTYPSLQKPVSLSEAAGSDLKQYSALFVPGGRAPMNDLMQDQDLRKILRFFHKENMITALICHGPVALTAALDDPAAYRKALVENDQAAIARLKKDWIYNGYDMTIFSNPEEVEALRADKLELPFFVADALKLPGGKMKYGAAMFQPFVVRDRELITGQNPASDHALADELLKALAEKK